MSVSLAVNTKQVGRISIRLFDCMFITSTVGFISQEVASEDIMPGSLADLTDISARVFEVVGHGIWGG
jgi:hypothetical protein